MFERGFCDVMSLWCAGCCTCVLPSTEQIEKEQKKNIWYILTAMRHNNCKVYCLDFVAGSHSASFASHLILICGTAVVSLNCIFVINGKWKLKVFRGPADELHGVQPAGTVLHLHQPAALRLLQPEHPGGPPPVRHQSSGQNTQYGDDPSVPGQGSKKHKRYFSINIHAKIRNKFN